MAITRTAKGYFAKLYIDDTTTIEGVPDTEITMARDGEWTLTPSMEDVRVRADGRHEKEESYGVKLTASTSIRVYANSLDTPGYQVLRDACLTGDPVHVILADKDQSLPGAELLEAWFEVSGFTRNSPISGHVDVPITFTETSAIIDGTRTPNAAFSTVGGGGGGGGGGGPE